MSRVGKMPIPVPSGVTVEVRDHHVTVQGPKGALERAIPDPIQVAVEDQVVTVYRPSDAKPHRALHGLTRALVANMVQGVSEGFTRQLELRGVGYRADVQGRKLSLQLGFSHPIEVEIPDGVEAEVEVSVPKAENEYLAAVITLRAADRQLLGDFAAKLRSLRPVEPYKGKGVRYVGERVQRKLGKAAKAGETVGF